VFIFTPGVSGWSSRGEITKTGGRGEEGIGGFRFSVEIRIAAVYI